MELTFKFNQTVSTLIKEVVCKHHFFFLTFTVTVLRLHRLRHKGFRKQSERFLNNESYDPAISLMGLYPRELKNQVHIRKYIWIIIIIVNSQKIKTTQKSVNYRMDT